MEGIRLCKIECLLFVCVIRIATTSAKSHNDGVEYIKGLDCFAFRSQGYYY